MNIQLALDRMSIQEAIDMARWTEPYIDWIEVGTSLIKEFGMASVEAMKREFPGKVIVADVKTFDNAIYEFELCYRAGADVATVMGASPPVTVDLCIKTARAWGRQVMIDLLHTTPEEQVALARYREAVHCRHVSKDQQENVTHLSGPGAYGNAPGTGDALTGNRGAVPPGAPGSASDSPKDLRIAAAGGITLDSLPGLLAMKPEVIIVGSAITKAADPVAAARSFQDCIRKLGRR